MQVAADGSGNWVGSERVFRLEVARLTDNGLTWTDPVNIDAGKSDYFPDLATDGAGTWLAVWHTVPQTGPQYDINVSSSTDAGATWTPAVVISNPIGFNGQPHVASDGAGHWVVVWFSDDPLGGSGIDRDILRATSSDTSAAAACAPAPSAACTAPDGAAAALLQLSNSTPHVRDSVLWKARTTVAAVPRPGAYTLCLYGQSGGLLFSAAAPTGTCDGSPCWQQVGSSSLRYKNRSRTPDGVDTVLIKASRRRPQDRRCAREGGRTSPIGRRRFPCRRRHVAAPAAAGRRRRMLEADYSAHIMRNQPAASAHEAIEEIRLAHSLRVALRAALRAATARGAAPSRNPLDMVRFRSPEGRGPRAPRRAAAPTACTPRRVGWPAAVRIPRRPVENAASP